MTKTIVRLAILLSVFSLVGIAGLNSAFDPRNVHRVSAFHVDIELFGEGVGGDLLFNVGVLGACPDALAGGDFCTALVSVENVGEEDLRLSQPTGSVSGVLMTCTGADPANPGVGGNNLSISIHDLSFTPNVTNLNTGDVETFQVTLTVAPDIPNACQNKGALITVEISADGDEPVVEEEDPTPTPTRTPRDRDDPTATPTPVIQTGGVVATATRTATPVRISETQPTRFPVTGQGGDSLSEDLASVAELLFLGTGLLAAGLFVAAIAIANSRKGGGK